ncbi:MAG: sodium-dependent transporter [Clostridia bacterium]|nr:sodium-dependent transporter [Clostridia bacterium]
MEKQRSSFTGKLGFVLAAAGSAVGLGNIWRFPYLAAKYGGGIFLLVYIILAVTFGFTLMMAEIAIGRKTGLSPVGAFAKLNKKFAFIGYLGAIIPMLILPYYSVIGGWVMKYLAMFISGNGADTTWSETIVNGDTTQTVTYFDKFVSGTGEPILWFVLCIAITMVVVLFGVEKGIEKVSKVMMPVLIVLSLFIAIYVMFLDGAWEGVVYYIKPDFSKFSIMTVISAMGQLFYSMSLAMGIMITYGSYMKKDVNIEKAVHQIEIFDTGVAFLAGLMIIPAVFVFGGEGDLAAGPSLMFKTLPKVFNTIWGGQVIGALFFILVLLAALTSSISLAETVVSVIQDKFKIDRKITCLIVLAGCLVLGLPSALGYGLLGGVKIIGLQFLDFFDFLSNSILMPIVAIFTCIFIGFILKPKAIHEEVEISAPFKAKKLFNVIIKYIAPVFLVAILVSSILDVFGIFKI